MTHTRFDPLHSYSAVIARHAQALRRDGVRMVGTLGEGHVQRGLSAVKIISTLDQLWGTHEQE